MSANMVNRDVVRFLVASASAYECYWRWKNIGDMDSVEKSLLGQALWDENAKSIIHRYPDCADHPENYPGVIGETYQFGPDDIDRFMFTAINPVQVLRTCDYYEYQSSEHPGWVISEAREFVNKLRNLAISWLPDYENAIWGSPSSIEVTV